jgi:hypothetical protein
MDQASQADGPVMLNCTPQQTPDFNASMVLEQMRSAASMDRMAVVNEQPDFNTPPAQTFAQSRRPMRNNVGAITNDFRDRETLPEEDLKRSKLAEKKKENITKKFFLQSLVV